MELNVEKSKKILEKKIKEKFPELDENKVKNIVETLIEQGQLVQEDDKISIELREDPDDFNFDDDKEVGLDFVIDLGKIKIKTQVSIGEKIAKTSSQSYVNKEGKEDSYQLDPDILWFYYLMKSKGDLEGFKKNINSERYSKKALEYNRIGDKLSILISLIENNKDKDQDQIIDNFYKIFTKEKDYTNVFAYRTKDIVYLVFLGHEEEDEDEPEQASSKETKVLSFPLKDSIEKVNFDQTSNQYDALFFIFRYAKYDQQSEELEEISKVLNKLGYKVPFPLEVLRICD